MKRGIVIWVIAFLFLGCISSKDVKKLSIDKRTLYPIGVNNKWGFANSEGKTVILPIYESVEFFSRGVALVKSNGKYGYLKKDGNWHIKPKYDVGSNFISNCALVALNRDTFYIDLKDRKMKIRECYPIDAGGCNIVLPADPNNYFKKFDGNFELVYKYYLQSDSTEYLTQFDTTNLKIEEVIEFGNHHVLVKKDGKYGLFDVWSHTRIIVDGNRNLEHKEVARKEIAGLINFKYDNVEFERFHDNEVTFAKVEIDNKYGVIDSRGNVMIEPKFTNLEIKPGWNIALVEYEQNKFGYKDFRGNEFYQKE